MPGTAYQPPSEPRRFSAPALAAPLLLAGRERRFLHGLQEQALNYFIDNQQPDGLVLDRQANRGGRRQQQGRTSTAATGMGLIALALASAEPYRLLSAAEARRRVRAALQTAWDGLPCDHGMLPHFVDGGTGRVYGVDAVSTIDSAWLIAGGLWAAAFLGDEALTDLARRVYERVDWRYWTWPAGPGATGLVRHGKRADGRFLECTWDRLNGETVFLYVLAAGCEEGKAVPAGAWAEFRPFRGELEGLCFNHSDLGLFVFQYGLDLLDGRRWLAPDGTDLAEEARLATLANERHCRGLAGRFATYRRFWGLSAGDGPGEGTGDDYRCYAPGREVDGTAHLTATLASVAHHPEGVLRQLHDAGEMAGLPARGLYGYSNVNLDRGWVSRDVVGIDAGAAVLALDNVLMHDRVRGTFHEIACVRRGLARFGFRAVQQASCA